MANAQLTKNSNEILESSRIMRSEMEKNVEFSTLKLKLAGGAFVRSILSRKHVTVTGGAFRKWVTLTHVSREMESQNKVAKKMANQLVDTKNKLLKLKGQLRAGGFLPPAKETMKGISVGPIGGGGGRGISVNDCPSPTESTASSNFCWELSSDEEEEDENV